MKKKSLEDRLWLRQQRIYIRMLKSSISFQVREAALHLALADVMKKQLVSAEAAYKLVSKR